MPTITPYIYRAAAAITALVPVLLPSEGTKEKGRQPRQGLATCVFNVRENRTDSDASIPASQRSDPLASQAASRLT